tara:strand:- start:247 stop:1539 length:1293 start_codon:yes stop_codon:yes gene_type:complete
MQLNLDPFSKLAKDISNLCPILKLQMETVDLNETSFLKDLIDKIKELDTNEICDFIAENDDTFYEIIATLVKSGEIDVKDGMIFTKRVVLKKTDEDTKARRLSFANTKFCDANLILKVEDLKKMTNLNYIFSMNGYHLPFCESSNQRGMYEHFFSEFLKEVDEKNKLSNQYKLILESIMIIYIITEMIADVIRAVFEIFDIVNIRIKSCSVLLDMAKVEKFNEVKNEVLNYLVEEFRQTTRVYSLFQTGKLLKIQSARNDVTNSWTAKVLTYVENIQNSLEKHKMFCDLFSAKMNELKTRDFQGEFRTVNIKRNSSLKQKRSSSQSSIAINLGVQQTEKNVNLNEEKCKRLCSDIFLYIQSYQNFVVESLKPDSNLNKSMKSCTDLLYYIDSVEDSLSEFKSPRLSGRNPNSQKSTPRSGFWNFLSPKKK